MCLDYIQEPALHFWFPPQNFTTFLEKIQNGVRQKAGRVDFAHLGVRALSSTSNAISPTISVQEPASLQNTSQLFFKHAKRSATEFY